MIRLVAVYFLGMALTVGPRLEFHATRAYQTRHARQRGPNLRDSTCYRDLPNTALHLRSVRSGGGSYDRMAQTMARWHLRCGDGLAARGRTMPHYGLLPPTTPTANVPPYCLTPPPAPRPAPRITPQARAAVAVAQRTVSSEALGRGSVELLKHWSKYLKEIQSDNAYPNWPRPPYNLWIARGGPRVSR